MHAFWLVLTYDLLEDRRIDDVIKTFFVLTTFWRHLWSITEQSTATWNLFVKHIV